MTDKEITIQSSETKIVEKPTIELVHGEESFHSLSKDFDDHRFQIYYSESQTKKKEAKQIKWLSAIFFAAFLIIIWLTVTITKRPMNPQDLLAFIGFSGFGCAMLYFIGIWVERENYYFLVSKEGIEFSKGWAQDILYRLNRRWDEIYNLELLELDIRYQQDGVHNLRELNQIVWQDDGTLNTRQCLRFQFKSGGYAFIFLNRLNRQQLRCLFHAIENYVDPSRLSREVIKAKNMLLLEVPSYEGYTDIWMEDLEQKFSTTSFLPLQPSHILRDGDYRITCELATRGQSAVYLAVDKKGEDVVIKELVAPQESVDKVRLKARELFEREVKLLLKVKHENVASVIDHFVEAKRDYIVMECVQGLNLRQKVRMDGKLEEKEVLDIVCKLLKIVGDLHRLEPPIIHRDLTPDNIVFKKSSDIAIVDFGAANEYLGGVTSTIVGKQSYMAPEQFRGHACPQSDLYSIGGTVFYLLTGKEPEALTELSLELEDKVVSEKFDQFVRRCTNFDLDERFSSCEEALQFLESGDKNAQ